MQHAGSYFPDQDQTMPLAMEAPSFNQWIIFRLYDSLPEKKKKTSKIESKMKQINLNCISSW